MRRALAARPAEGWPLIHWRPSTCTTSFDIVHSPTIGRKPFGAMVARNRLKMSAKCKLILPSWFDVGDAAERRTECRAAVNAVAADDVLVVRDVEAFDAES